MTGPSEPSVGRKAGGTVRGGGGVCPARQHGAYMSINLAEAQDLARTLPGRPRKLTEIPDGSRIEATGLRIEGVPEGHQVRASIGTVLAGYPKPVRRPAELEKRTKAEWNGLHVNIANKQELWVNVLSRVDATSSWHPILEVCIDPLEAFSVEDQDVRWFATAVPQEAGPDLTVWVEFSLMVLTSSLLDRIKKKGIATKQRKLEQKTFEPKRHVCAIVCFVVATMIVSKNAGQGVGEKRQKNKAQSILFCVQANSRGDKRGRSHAGNVAEGKRHHDAPRHACTGRNCNILKLANWGMIFKDSFTTQLVPFSLVSF